MVNQTLNNVKELPKCSKYPEGVLEVFIMIHFAHYSLLPVLRIYMYIAQYRGTLYIGGGGGGRQPP